MPKIKNIAIFVAILAVLSLGYIYFIKMPAEEDNLVSSSSEPLTQTAASSIQGTAAAREFLTLLLSVRNIRLDDAILSDPAFANLDGSHSIVLTPDGSEGRPNPFAPLGSDLSASPSIPVGNQNTGTPRP